VNRIVLLLDTYQEDGRSQGRAALRSRRLRQVDVSAVYTQEVDLRSLSRQGFSLHLHCAPQTYVLMLLKIEPAPGTCPARH
jgi:hypothetical protein